MKYFFFLLMNVVSFSMLAQPPNNAIFTGGNNDGADKAAFAQAASNIFTGGINDGWSKSSYQQAGGNIFQGGAGDGWNNTIFIQTGNNIFNGGNGDGWAKISFLQAGNGIFNGGDGDGWSKINFLQAGNNIFSGGVGDGWAFTYLPAGPLPVKFLSFSARKQSLTSALLSWETADEINASHYDVERSNDAVHFNKLGVVRATGSGNTSASYQFTDNDPEQGYNYYRLKQVDADGRFIYTPARLVNFKELSTGQLRFFPNPTHGILNVEVTQAAPGDVMLVTIANASGMLMNQQQLVVNGGKVVLVNMARYAKGIYFVQVAGRNINSTQRVVLQ